MRLGNERYRKGAIGVHGWRGCNLRTTFLKIIRRAGLTPWERAFHNIRASRETELVERFPVHVVTAWLGNTPEIARRHYLQVTDQHFEQAASPKPAAHRAALALQQPAVTPRNTDQDRGNANLAGVENENTPQGSKASRYGAWQVLSVPCAAHLSHLQETINGEDRIRTCGGL